MARSPELLAFFRTFNQALPVGLFSMLIDYYYSPS